MPRAGWCVPACYVNRSYYIPLHVLSRLSAWKPVRGTVLLSRTGLIGRLIRKFQYCDGVKLKLFFLTTPELNGIGLGFCCARRPACSKHSPSLHPQPSARQIQRIFPSSSLMYGKYLALVLGVHRYKQHFKDRSLVRSWCSS